MIGMDNVLDELRVKCINGLSNGACRRPGAGSVDPEAGRPKKSRRAYRLQIKRDNQPKRWRDDVGGDKRQRWAGEAAS
jgi:hypothetical protein